MLYNLLVLLASIAQPKNTDYFNQYYNELILEKQFELSVIAKEQVYISSSYFEYDFKKKNYFAISDTFISYLSAVPLNKDSVLISEIVPQYLAQIDKFKAKYKGNYVLSQDYNLINGLLRSNDIEELLSRHDLNFNIINLGDFFYINFYWKSHYISIWQSKIQQNADKIKATYTNTKSYKVDLEKIQNYIKEENSLEKNMHILNDAIFKNIDFSKKEIDLYEVLAIVEDNCNNVLKNISIVNLDKFNFSGGYRDDSYPYSYIKKAIIK